MTALDTVLSAVRVPERTVLVRVLVFGATAGLLAFVYSVSGSGTSTAGATVHVVLESLATSWALGAGAIALIRYYSRKTDTYLFVGTAFLGSAIFDGFHVSAFYLDWLPSDTHLSVAPWSWVASRLFMAAFLCFGWFVSRRARSAAGGWSELTVYWAGGALVLASFAVFTLVPLPVAYLEGPGGRPAEIVPLVIFLVALAGFLRSGGWREDAFEFSLVLSILLAVATQGFMYASRAPFDSMFGLAHGLKLASYAVVVGGLLSSTFHLFQRAEASGREIQAANAALRAEVDERIRAEEDLRALGASLEEQVRARTNDLEESRREALRALEIAQAARRQAEIAGSQFRQLLESAPDAMVIVNEEGSIEFVNTAAERLFGYERSELWGKPIETLVPLAARSRHESQRAGYMEHATLRPMGQGMSLSGRRKDGSDVPIEISLSPVEIDGRLLVSAGIYDLSERKASEAALARYTGELERSNEELGQFAYVVSHDLQEPLRMVSSFTQLLAKRYEGKLGPDADEFISYAVGGARRMQALIHDLLTYSRVGTHGDRFRPVATRAVAQAALDNLKLAISESGARVSLRSLPRVSGDPAQLLSLFQNLIENAIKFRSDVPTEVQVSARREGEGPIFRVRDNGIGIAPEYREQVFKIFKRLHHRDEYPGTGIGLALCKRIVERHGGRIWIESSPGRGTTICFTLNGSKEAR